MRSAARVLASLLCVVMACAATGPWAFAAGPTVYYVDPAGSDSNNGDATHPFQHIQRCADLMDPATGATTCIINSGTYHETVRPARSGTAANPITYEAATGAAVRVDGTDFVNGWTAVQDSDVTSMATTNPWITASPFAKAVHLGTVYRAHAVLNSSLPASQLLNSLLPTVPQLDPTLPGGKVPGATPADNQVFLGDQMAPEAQFPDPAPDPLNPSITYDPLSPTVAIAKTGSTLANIVDPALNEPDSYTLPGYQLPGYWTGAHVYIQQNWKADTGIVGSSVPGSIAIAGYTGYYYNNWDTPVTCENVGAGDTRYFLYGKLSELNAPGEWFYDSANQYLYLRPTTPGQPGLNTVSAKQRQLGFDLRGRSYTVVNGIQLFGTSIATDGTGNSLQSLQVSYPSHFMDFVKDPNTQRSTACDSLSAGVTTTGLVIGGSGNEVKDSNIAYSAGNGIALLGNNNRATNNVIHDIDYSGGRGAGIYLIGNSQTVSNNTIYKVGRAGIESNSTQLMTSDLELENDDVSYNDIYNYGRLEQDVGAIYVCCAPNMASTKIHHNWLHDPQTYPGVPNSYSIGIYLDGDVNNALVYDNVGWGNRNGTVGLISGNNHSVSGTGIYNNDGGIFISAITAVPGSMVGNNIGPIVELDSRGQEVRVIPRETNLLPPTDPQYNAPGARDYTLQPTSPARNAATQIPGVTDGPVGLTTSDPTPTEGAYQYGATTAWIPGAARERVSVNHPVYGPNSVISMDTPAWATQNGPPLGAMDSHPDNPYAYFGPNTSAVDGHLKLAFPNQTANGTIDKVLVRFYASMHRHLPVTTANATLTLTGLGGGTGTTTVFDAGGQDFDSVGVPFTKDITSQVGGNWANLPTQADIHGTMSWEPQLGYGVASEASFLEVYAVEIYIEAH